MRPTGAHPVYWRTFEQPMPTGWILRSFRELAENVKGKLPKKDLSPTPIPDGIPYLLVEGLESGQWSYTDDITLPQVTVDDSVVVADGSRSGWALRGKSGALGSTLLCYRPKNGVNSDYLFYLLQSFYAFTNTATIGGAVPHLDTRLLDHLQLYIPPTQDEQAAIGNRLKGADEALAAAQQKLWEARRLKTALMQQLFTRGIPGRHNRFKQTKIGNIPESWELVLLGQVAGVVSGIALNSDREPRFHPRRYITVIHVQRERLVLADIRHLEVFPNELPGALLESGDIVLVEGHANSSEIGRAAIVTNEATGFAFQNHLFRVRPNADAKLDRNFLLGVLNSERVRRHWVATCNTSSGLNTINRRGLRRLLIQRPSPEEQVEISATLTAANDNIYACEQEVVALDRLKRSLLQNLLTGRVRVSA